MRNSHPLNWKRFPAGGGVETLLERHRRPIGGISSTFGGSYTLEAQKPPEAAKNGKNGKRKIAVLLAAVTAITFLLGGCDGKADSEAAQQKADYEAQTAIKQQIEDTPIPRGHGTLLDDTDNWVVVLCQNGEATVSIRAYMNFTIPYVAEDFMPVAQEAAEAAGVTLAEFRVQSYNTNKDGIVSGSFASWATEDGETGILADEVGTDLRSDGTTVDWNMTLEELYEYYSDFADIVDGMITEAGGNNG